MRALLVVGLIFAAVIGGLAFWWVYFCFPYASAGESGASFNRGENGLWLRYLWYAGDAKYWASSERMIEHLKDDQIKYAFFHVRELGPAVSEV